MYTPLVLGVSFVEVVGPVCYRLAPVRLALAVLSACHS